MFDFPDDRGQELTADLHCGLTLDPAGSFLRALCYIAYSTAGVKEKARPAGRGGNFHAPRIAIEQNHWLPLVLQPRIA
jgi:hypothetical protein